VVQQPAQSGAKHPTSGPLLIENCEVVLPDRVIKSGAVLMDRGAIIRAGRADQLPPKLPEGCQRIDAGGDLACPSLWEMHLHGCGGISTENMTPGSLAAMAEFLASRGVGGFVPTTTPDERFLECLGKAIDAGDGVPVVRGRVPGMHVEGPFIAAARRGGIPEHLVEPASTERLEQLAALANGRIRIMTFAPEIAGARDLVERMRSLGILPSLGHSDAPWAALAEYEGMEPLGITHLYNAMSGVSHKEPGLAQWGLLDRHVYTELNCDGTHVHDAAVALALRARPWERLVLISDAIAPAGLHAEGAPPMLYGKPLVAKGSGFFYADTGVLVGSRLLIGDGVARLVSEFKVPLAQAVAMASLNPARYLGFSRKGALLPGYDADVAIMSRDFGHCSLMIWEGRKLFGA
jgi:N-acetylglucosamine-6-phosphate deacetylase